ncbi:OLC1v1008329C1 [Oldenlandia corymbosa var. corymbosa]|uniref:OLC1v1008329C1 n=1 Tax=Oldenlandia corymbosa var. corymbosa TaxID=529605 RepID=A0AAV1DLI4_OLDCO|nr:OLC1v1008329C1 [Oldenlandia corymbosa var. corymbosa]
MGRKGGKYKKKDSNTPKTKSKHYDDGEEDMMNDEIDAFHNQRDIVPLDVDEDEAESDEENEQPVFDLEDDDEDDSHDDDFIENDSRLTGRAAKIARQQKYLQAKIGGVEEEIDNDEEEEDKHKLWGRRKKDYYDAEAQSSDDDEVAAEEEAEAMRLQREKEKTLTADDYGLEDDNDTESDQEPTFEESLTHGKPLSKAKASKAAEDDGTITYEEIKKDLNDLTREEQMDVVLSSAPELVGLLTELGDTVEQLENRVNPLLVKIREADKATKGGLQFVEMKQQLLLSYCQAITFYLLLKSEGQPVRDHPVISRLVEIKNLLDKMKELDKYLPPHLEDTLQEDDSAEGVEKQVVGYPMTKSSTGTGIDQPSVEIPDKPEALQGSQLVDEIPLKGQKLRKLNSKQQDTEVGKQSIEMLKVRAAIEEKLRQKGIVTSISKKNEQAKKRLRPMNGQFETVDDFDDDALDLDNVNHQMSMRNSGPQAKKHKVVLGGDDLPNRDDIGERRREHELRVLAGAGIKSLDDVDDIPGTAKSDGDSDTDLDSQSESDLEFYKQAEEGHLTKLAQKSQMYSRVPQPSSLPESLVDGKRQISYQIQKNRGLTRSRNKLTKNPRKKYKLKHDKAKKRLQGLRPDMRKPTGPYGGETTGINDKISRSTRF